MTCRIDDETEGLKILMFTQRKDLNNETNGWDCT